mmetsp:Transcript_32902/g.58344  ORF Transcript_32902/g.58344 Transcript_32902/m.58344 type:complete len:87 (+) Transcript_32902:42-302(+)
METMLTGTSSPNATFWAYRTKSGHNILAPSSDNDKRLLAGSLPLARHFPRQCECTRKQLESSKIRRVSSDHHTGAKLLRDDPRNTP